MMGEVFCLDDFAFFQWLAVNTDYITDQSAGKKKPGSSTLNGTLVTFISLYLAKAQKENMSKRMEDLGCEEVCCEMHLLQKIKLLH